MMAQVGLQRTLEWPGARVCFLPLVMVSTALVSFSAMAMEMDGKRNRQAFCESKTKVLGKRRACTTILAKCVKKLVVLKYFLSHNLAHRAHAIVLIRHDHCIEGHEVGNWWQTSLTSGSTHRPTIYNVLKSSSALCPTVLEHCTKPTSLLILQSGRHYGPLYWFGSVWRMQISH